MIRRTLSFKSLMLSCFLLTISMSMVGCNNDDDVVIKDSKNDSGQVTPIEELVDGKISAGFKHSIVLTPDGKLFGWGDSSTGELSEKSSKVAPKIIDESLWSSVSCGYESTIGIKKDGTLWATGYNNTGQLGLGSTEDVYQFTQVGTSSDWKMVSLGYRHALGLKKDGTLWAWGNNEFFQLGNGSDAPSFVPIQVGTDSDWENISAAHNQSFAIKKDGTLWAWGYNLYGQLGLGSKVDISVPTKVESTLKWKTVVTGISFTGGIKEDGTLWMWGRNYHGQLGIGTGNMTMGNDTEIPMLVESDKAWKKISLGNGHILAIKEDNTLWSWGKNQWGELGIGGETGYSVYKNVPTKVNDDTDWEDISAGELFSIAKKKDNSYWAFGANRSGQVSTENDEEDMPVKIFNL